MRTPIIAVWLGVVILPQAARAAEVWHCTLHPQGEQGNIVEFSFEVRGNTLLRSPDDYSGNRLSYGITKNNPTMLAASAYRGTPQKVVLRKLEGAGTMTAGAGPGWQDVWEGPCHKA